MVICEVMRIIGLTGHPSSGKDTLAHHLETRGFTHISTGDALRSEMKEQGIIIDRPHMHDFVNAGRAVYGPGYLAEGAIKLVKGDTVISGLRNVSETNILKAHFGDSYTLVALEAPIETRYKWAQGRGRDGDGLSFEQFKAQEEIERHGSPETQQVDDVILMADYVIQNTDTKEEFLHKIDEIIALL